MDKEIDESWRSGLGYIRTLRKPTETAMSDCVRGGHRNGKWSDRQEQARFKRNSRAFGQLDDVERS